MSNNSSLLFLHGGPGFNSFAEAKFLGPLLSHHGLNVLFWNKPSVARTDGYPFKARQAYSNCLASAAKALKDIVQENGPAHVVAHSFGANLAFDLALEHADSISGMTIVSSAFLPHEVCKKILALALADFQNSAPEKAKALKEEILRSSKLMDEAMQRAFAIAAEDQLLMSHYWQDTDKMQAYFSAWAEKNAGMDSEAFFQVLTDFAKQRPRKSFRADIPVHLIFGDRDPIVDQQLELAYTNKIARRVQTTIFESAGHFPHFENPEKFTRSLVMGL